MHGPFQVLEVKKGEHAFKLDILSRWKVHPIFHVSLLEPGRESVREGREQHPRAPEEIKGDLKWKVEKIVKSEIITYMRRVGIRNKELKKLCYVVKWKGCTEDENTWQRPEELGNAHELVEEFHPENPEMPGLSAVS